MRRREFTAALGAAAVTWPLAAYTRQTLRKIGALIAGGTETRAVYVRALSEGLEALGWIEGLNIQVEYRWATSIASKPTRLIWCF